MDKYEYRIRAEEINGLIEREQYAEAVKIADTIDWNRVKSVMMLCKISDLYKVARRYEDAKELLLLAYGRQPGGRKIVYSLCEVAIKLEETVQAVEYYKEFVQVAPRDTGRFILQYKLYEAQDVSLEERISVLEEFKKRDYREKWAYELAYLYHRIGLATRCVEECDELVLWFGEGDYVIKALELKQLHVPLTREQQIKYDMRFHVEPEVTEETEEDLEKTMSIEIKSIEPSKAITAEIKGKEIDEINEAQEEQEAISDDNQGEVSVQDNDTVNVDTIPIQVPDLDIHVKTMDVGEYNTINLQQELAQSLSKLLAEEDMEAMDATLMLPVDAIIDTEKQAEVFQAISDDAIKNTLLAPLLQDTMELTPITEEDLLASVEQEKRDEQERLKELERLEEEAKQIQAKLEEEAKQQEKARLEEEAKQQEQARLEEEARLQELAKLEEELKIAAQNRIAYENEMARQFEEEKQKGPSIGQGIETAANIVGSVANAAGTAATAAINGEAQVLKEASTGAILAAEIAQAVTSGNVSSLPISQVVKESTNQENVDEQITGQLSLTDIMSEWEETKKANEEKRIAKMREKVMKQTGPMFSNFDEVARNSVQSDLNIISPTIDIFKEKEVVKEEKETQKVTEEATDPNEDVVALVEEALEEESLEKDSKKGNIVIPRDVLNTAEIKCIEEKLIEVLLTKTANEEEPYIDPDLGKEIEHILVDEQEAEKSEVEEPEVEKPETEKPEAEKSEVVEPEIENQQVEEESIAEDLELTQEPIEEVLIAPTQEIPQEEIPQEETLQEEIPQEETPQEEITPAPINEVDIAKYFEEVSKEVTESLESTASVAPDTQNENQENQNENIKNRLLTKEEKELLGHIAPLKEGQEQLCQILDKLSLQASVGNGLVIAEHGIDREVIARGFVESLQQRETAFTGPVAKIDGKLLATKDILNTLKSLENGALIIEDAGDIEADILGTIVHYLESNKIENILVIMCDTKEEIEKILITYPNMLQMFTAKLQVDVLDNDNLVQFAKVYANDMEYSIDEMGVLAIYTRIAEMQTIEHAVTVVEVKEMVNDAIDKSKKKSVKNFMNVIIGKRYDDEDMVILREDDFYL